MDVSPVAPGSDDDDKYRDDNLQCIKNQEIPQVQTVATGCNSWEMNEIYNKRT